jgi:hypothetical protein
MLMIQRRNRLRFPLVATFVDRTHPTVDNAGQNL